jgi:hypothetical protein
MDIMDLMDLHLMDMDMDHMVILLMGMDLMDMEGPIMINFMDMEGHVNLNIMGLIISNIMVLIKANLIVLRLDLPMHLVK